MSAPYDMVLNMNSRTRSLRTDLRYLLVLHIHRHGLTTVSEMVTMLTDIGFDVDGRPSKTISDALRTDVQLELTAGSQRGRPSSRSPATLSRIWVVPPAIDRHRSRMNNHISLDSTAPWVST